MRYLLLILSLAAGIVETVLIGIAYFGHQTHLAQTAFWIMLAFTAVNFLYTLATGKASTITTSKPAGARLTRTTDLLSRAALVFLALGAFGGQSWALGWAFWIDAAFIGYILLLLVFLGGALVLAPEATKRALVKA